MGTSYANFALLLALAASPGASGGSPRPREVIVLYSDRIANVDDVFSARLQAAPGGANLVTEHLDLTRLEDTEYVRRLTALLRRKYQSRRVDLIIPVGMASLSFGVHHRDDAFPGVPVVFSTVDSERLQAIQLPPFIAGIAGRVVALKTAEAALSLQPQTRRIVLVGGESPTDRYWRQRIRKELRPLESRAEIVVPEGRTLPELLDLLRALPDQTIVFFMSLRADAAGSSYPGDAIRMVAEASRVPVYVAYEEALGTGAVGGYTFGYDREAEKAAAVALRVLRGERPQDVGVDVVESNAYVFDWRALRRWNIPENRLPPGSVVRFRPPSPWVVYRREIMAALGLVLLQTALVVGLLVQARRRRRAERDLDERLRFETLFSETTRRLTHAEVASLDGEIEDALRRLGLALAVDRADIGEFAEGSGDLVIRYSYAEDPAYRQLPPVIDAGGAPWVAKIQVPLSTGGAPLGGLGLGMLGERAWPADLARRLEMWAETFGNALMRRRLERLLEESRETGGPLLGSLYGHVAVLDRHGTIVAVNDTWARATRAGEPWETALPVGANYLEVCRSARDHDGAGARAVLDGLVSVLDRAAPTFAIEYRSDTDRERWLELLAEPLVRAEGGAVITLVDVTDRKRAELEVGRLRDELAHVTRVSTLGELAASLAHELNQPLAAILSNAQAAQILLRRPSPDLDEIREILAEVVADDERAGQVIKRLRALYKKGQGERAPLDMNDLIREVVNLLGNDAALRGAVLRLDLGAGLPPVAGDRIQLQQVMLNLMVNGLDAMQDLPNGQRRLSVRSGFMEAKMRIEVADTGRGVPEAHRQRLFEPFFTTKPAGMGMGLAIARSIVHAHGGELSLVSPPGSGATFQVTIPALT